MKKLFTLFVAITATLTLWAGNVITYTATSKVTPNNPDAFGAKIISNTFADGTGTITFDSEVTSIGDRAFGYSSNLTSITIPESVTSIERYAFLYCYNLTAITIPESVTDFNSLAFYDCTIQTVRMEGLCPPSSPGYLPNNAKKILVPDLALPLYQNWGSNGNYETYDITAELLASADYKEITTTAKAGDEPAILEQISISELSTIKALKVNGTINGNDILMIRNKMINLRYLDLTDARIVAGGNEYYEDSKKYYTQDDILTSHCFDFERTKIAIVKLPSTLKEIQLNVFNKSKISAIYFQDGITSIPNSCFENHTALGLVELPSTLRTIGSSAFRNTNLYSITIPANVETIGSRAFYSGSSDWSSGSHSLRNVVFEAGSKITTIPDYAFRYQPITSITFPEKLTTIGYNAFQEIAVETLSIPNTVTSIGTYSFRDGNYQHLIIPESIKNIPQYAFAGNSSLRDIQISSMVETIANYAFADCNNIQDVYVYTYSPRPIQQQTFSCWTSATLHHPAASTTNYFLNTQWSQFQKLVPFDAHEDGYLDADHKIGCGDNSTISGAIDLAIREAAGLVLCDGQDQELDSVTQTIGTGAGSIIACDNLKAHKLTVQIELKVGEWFFLGVPENISEVDLVCDAQRVIYLYDGSERAQGNVGWKAVADREILHKGRGYIIQASANCTLSLTISNPHFTCETYVQSLEQNSSVGTPATDAGWNMISNPFPSYYDIRTLLAMLAGSVEAACQTPIYIYNAKKNDYEAYIPTDDPYYLRPYEAVFLQNPGTWNSINWDESGRYTQKQVEAEQSAGAKAMQKLQARRAQAAAGREFVELSLTNEFGAEDHTRVVFNEKAALNYEIGMDAIKMDPMGYPEVRLYTLDNETSYAINERPFAEGNVRLGYMAAEDGYYVLSATRLDKNVLIYDNVENKQVDLSISDYGFYTEAGTNETRFSILKAPNTATDIDALVKSSFYNENVNIFTLSGMTVAENVRLSDVQLTAGTYVVQGETKSQTVLVR